LLVYGGSDSDGSNLADPEKAWPRLVCRHLEPRLGEPVELIHRRMYVHVAGWDAYAERVLDEASPGMVILAASAFGWAYRSVPIRIRKIFGERAGQWAEGRQQWLDAGAEGSRLVAAAAQALHWTTRRIIPAAAYLPRAEAERRWLALIDRLAREEDLPVLVTGTTFLRGEALRSTPGINAQIAQFNAVLERRARARHLTWFDREAILSAMNEEEAFLGDHLHRREVYHEQMAERIVELLAPSGGQ
jgi:hypothetical protein